MKLLLLLFLSLGVVSCGNSNQFSVSCIHENKTLYKLFFDITTKKIEMEWFIPGGEVFYLKSSIETPFEKTNSATLSELTISKNYYQFHIDFDLMQMGLTKNLYRLSRDDLVLNTFTDNESMKIKHSFQCELLERVV